MTPSVLHLAQPVDGGVAAVLRAVVADQAARGWQVVVGCPAGPGLSEELRDLGLGWVDWPAARAKRAATPAQVRGLGALVRRVDPQVVHLHSASAGITGRLAVRADRPTIYQPHGWTWQSEQGALARAAVGWERLAQRWTDALVCVSQAERDAGRAHGLTVPMRVVPNSVDLDRFRPADAAGRAAARARLGLPDSPLVVCVGRLDDQKGQVTLVQAWPAVLRELPAARLALVGTGPMESELAATVARDGLAQRVLLPGPSREVHDWYAAADVVAFSSRYGEAMALTPLEAQASGRSLVATDVAGVREALGPGAGALVPAGDAAAMASALVARLGDAVLAAAEGAAGRRHAEARLGSGRSLDLLAGLTEELARGRSR